jgi:ABC-type transport system involved in multi-copper enzyme maturation permease subunit
MLWYKSWLEGRSRFLVALFFMIAYCALIMPLLVLIPALHAHASTFTPSYITLINTNVYYNAPVIFFLVFAMLLGLGGLSHERSRGTAAFTLSLPVNRSRIVVISAVVGLIEISLLALSPAVAVICLSYALHGHYPLLQLLEYCVLWLPCGALWFSIALAISNVVRDEYAAYAASIGSFLLYLVLAFSRLHLPSQFNLLRIMSGEHMPYSGPNLALRGPLPWEPLLILAFLALTLIAISCRVVQRQDF